MKMLDAGAPLLGSSNVTARLSIEVTAILLMLALQAVSPVLQVQEWEVKVASSQPMAIVDSSTAKRRKVYFGCRDAYNDPQVPGSVLGKHEVF